jgi:hypothetical protein
MLEGRYLLIESSSANRLSSTSIMTSVAHVIFPMLAVRNWSSGSIVSWTAGSAIPGA